MSPQLTGRPGIAYASSAYNCITYNITTYDGAAYDGTGYDDTTYNGPANNGTINNDATYMLCRTMAQLSMVLPKTAPPMCPL